MIMAKKQWRCFHCDQLFRSYSAANKHLGYEQFSIPACLLSQAEEGLVNYIRKLEIENSEYRNESHEVLMAAYSIQMDARGIEQKAEQRGYDQAVKDMYLLFADPSVVVPK